MGGMNVNWLALPIFIALGLLFLSLPVGHLAGVRMDGYAPGLGMMMGAIFFLLAGVAVRELLRRKRPKV
jgi:hypothetical protein